MSAPKHTPGPCTPARLDAYDQCECGHERSEHVPGGAAALDGCNEFRLAYRYLATTPPPTKDVVR